MLRRWLRERLCRHRDVLPDTLRFEDGSVVKVLRCQHCRLVREKPFATDMRVAQANMDPRFRMSRRENMRRRWLGLARGGVRSAAVVKARTKAS